MITNSIAGVVAGFFRTGLGGGHRADEIVGDRGHRRGRPGRGVTRRLWFCDRRAEAVIAVVRSFCAEVAVLHRLNADGEIMDEEARELAGNT